MKNLVFINGTMGVGKTTTSKELQHLLPACVFLDGDWCWDSHPFIVTEETKEMVVDNIVYLINNYLRCTAYESIIFCWVMHEESIIQQILERIITDNCKVFLYSLICTEEALRRRVEQDILKGNRMEGIIDRSISRLCNYEQGAEIIYCTSRKGKQAEEIAELILQYGMPGTYLYYREKRGTHRYSTVRRLNITGWWRMMGLSEKKEVEQWVMSREIRLGN